MGQGQTSSPQSQKSGCLNLCISRRYYMQKQIQKQVERYNRQSPDPKIHKSKGKNKVKQPNNINTVKSLPKYNIINQKSIKIDTYDKATSNKNKQPDVKQKQYKKQTNMELLSNQVILLGLQSNVVQQEPKNIKQDKKDNPKTGNNHNNITHITQEGLQITEGATANQNNEEGNSQYDRHSVYENSLSSNKFSNSLNSNRQLLINKIDILKKKYDPAENQKYKQKADANNNLNQNATNICKNQQQNLKKVQDQQNNKLIQSVTNIKLDNGKNRVNLIVQPSSDEKQQNSKKITEKHIQNSAANSLDKKSIENNKTKLQKLPQGQTQKKVQKQIMKKPSVQKINNNAKTTSAGQKKQPDYLNPTQYQKPNLNQVTQIVQFFSQSQSSSSSSSSSEKNDQYFFTSQHVFGNKINNLPNIYNQKNNIQNQNSQNSINLANAKLTKANRVAITQSAKTQQKNSLQNMNAFVRSRKIVSLNSAKLITF